MLLRIEGEQDRILLSYTYPEFSKFPRHFFESHSPECDPSYVGNRIPGKFQQASKYLTHKQTAWRQLNKYTNKYVFTLPKFFFFEVSDFLPRLYSP